MELETQKKRLQTEQTRCTVDTKANSNKASSTVTSTSSAALARDTKLKKDLQEKSEQLDSKLAQLRIKEQECSKLAQQREKAATELQKLQTNLQEATQQKGDLARKLKVETAAHEQEKKLLRMQEMQCRRREQLAQYAVAKMEKQLLNKEKVPFISFESYCSSTVLAYCFIYVSV